MALIRKLLFVSVFFMAGLVPAPLVYADKTVDDKGFIRLKNGEEAWTDFPGVPGLKLMIIEGDPKKSGPYVVRYRFPSGVMSRPHFHPEDRFITVIQGTWWTGTGETFDPKNTVALPAGVL